MISRTAAFCCALNWLNPTSPWKSFVPPYTGMALMKL